MRTVLLPAIIFSGLALAGCQTAMGSAAAPGKTPSAELAKQREMEMPRRERVAIEVKVARLGGAEALAVTRGDIETDRPFEFRTHRQGEIGDAELGVEVVARSEAFYAVKLKWSETTPDGRSVRWSPTLAVQEAVESQAEIAWTDGDGRRITVKLTRPGSPPASAPAQVPASSAGVDPPAENAAAPQPEAAVDSDQSSGAQP
jgi:hypothetical protein